MSLASLLLAKTRATLGLYFTLLKIIVPVTLAAEVLARTGVIAAVSPVLAPLMNLFGLPPDLGLAWLTGMLVGIWSAILIVFTLVPVESLTVADMTVFSALLLVTHSLPIEQKIIQKAGPGMLVTTVIRVLGGMLYAGLLHAVLAATGWLSQPLKPVWIPMSGATTWTEFFLGFGETLLWMLVILIALAWLLDFLKWTGLMDWLMKLLDPVLRLAAVRGDARQLTAVGMFLGVTYGGALLIRDARSGKIPPRQVFIACIFMGFSHSLIEDTLILMALGADAWGIVVGRMIFAVIATALVARWLATVPDDRFYARYYHGTAPAPAPSATPAGSPPISKAG